jgi:guanylate kinase
MSKLDTTLTIEEFVQEMDRNYPIVEYIKDLPKFKNLPRVFENNEIETDWDKDKPFLLLLNGTMASGKSSLANALEEEGIVNIIPTATSRLRRSGEKPYSYTYMRLRKLGESIEEFHKNLIKEYDLVEYDFHHGNLYGLPRERLKDIEESEEISVILNEPQGARRLEEILGDRYNILVVFIVPESWTSILRRVDRSGRMRDHLKQRFVDSLEMLRQSKEVAHIYLQNSQFPLDSRYGNGFEEAKSYLKRVVEYFT